MDRHSALSEVCFKRCIHLGCSQGYALRGQHRVAMLLQVSADCFAVVLEGGSCFSQEDRSLTLALRSLYPGRRFALQNLQESGDVLCQVIELHPEVCLRLGAEGLVQ